MADHITTNEARRREYYHTLKPGTTTDVYVQGMCLTMEYLPDGTWLHVGPINKRSLIKHRDVIMDRLEEELPEYGRADA